MRTNFYPHNYYIIQLLFWYKMSVSIDGAFFHTFSRNVFFLTILSDEFIRFIKLILIFKVIFEGQKLLFAYSVYLNFMKI